MIVDTSAIVEVLLDTDRASRFRHTLARSESVRISVGTLLETAIVVDANRNPVLSGRLDDMVSRTPLHVEPVTERHIEVARRAYQVFGKGSGHPARLNFGDCFAYALARTTGEPLLFAGDDFSKTDVTPALP